MVARKLPLVRPALVASLLLACSLGCGDEGGASLASSGSNASSSGDASGAGASGGGQASGATSTSSAGSAGGAGGEEPLGPCETRIQYGPRWIRPDGATSDVDVTAGVVTWDGVCVDDGPNSYALLSNGWKPYFNGNARCAIALDRSGDCGLPAETCASRVSYGPGWLPPPNHPESYDDVAGRVFAADACNDKGGGVRSMRLSNGWEPHFEGACSLSIRWTQCGGLYANPVIPTDCPDPAVLAVGDEYFLVGTKSSFAGLFMIHRSTDLVRFEEVGYAFPGTSPPWAVADFWAPELHSVGDHYVLYYSARTSEGHLAIGAASAPSPVGPFTDLGQPLIDEKSVGHIDAHRFEDESGQGYLVWKDDGNAFGQPTPIWAQPLSSDGLALIGQKTLLLSNTLGWEGALVEGPWVVFRDGFYYLFYSGNAYYDSRYAVGVARSASPLGPYEKLGAPILTTGGAWAGPGHGAVVVGPSGDDVFVHHAWRADAVGGGPGRVVLVERIQWSPSGPSLFGAPSSGPRPAP